MNAPAETEPDAVDIAARYAALLRFEPDHRLVQYQGDWTSVGDAAALAAALDARLRGCGLAEPIKVGLITRNRPGQVLTILATLLARRCLVPITSIQSDAATIAEVDRTRIGVLVADHEDWSRTGLVEHCAARGILGLEMPVDRSGPLTVVASPEAPRPETVPAPDVAVLMPTSGTTGPPKRISYRYSHVNGALGRIARYSGATGRTLGGEIRPRAGVVVAALPLAHVAGFWTVLQALAEGRSISLLDRFEPTTWSNLIKEHRVRVAMIPPTTLGMVLDADVPVEHLSTLRAVLCGTAPLDPELQQAFTSRYGVPVLTAYGATEFPGGLVGWTLDDYHRFHTDKPRSAGRARPGIGIKIVDQNDGSDLPFDREGLVAVHSPQATTSTVDGWVRTNDIGRMDADGFLWIVGRADDAINRGGFKIVPQVVEAALREHPAVREAAVVGIAEPRLGQVPVAVVTLRVPVEPQQLLEWVRERLTKYQVPISVRVVEELPRTTSMKVSKEAVRQLFASE
ncbi:class I adenylate-forming enzyme family protein [Pseudonocardia sp. GCM10023141]|uniref:class I adenylate-forming enzyme family protein n=1 Tax=Pseudonocardia sp. GCM10023141 TaxID=3252653 RepID=UPI00360AE980